MTFQMIELRCSRELALWLGAVDPKNMEEHRLYRASGHYILIRTTVTLQPMFWLVMGQSPQLQ